MGLSWARAADNATEAQGKGRGKAQSRPARGVTWFGASAPLQVGKASIPPVGPEPATYVS